MDQGGVEPQLVSQDSQFELFAAWKAQIGRLEKSCPPKPHFSFSTGELAMLLCIAGHAWELLKYCTFQTIPRMNNWWEGEVFRLGGRAVLFVGLLLLAYHTSLLPFELLGKTTSASPVQQWRGTNVERNSKPLIQWRRPISEVTSGDVVRIRAVGCFFK